MSSLLAVIGASLTTFAATNVDDIFLLTIFFAGRVPARRIIGGQYLGFAAIIGVSLVGVWAALAIPHRWIRALGLLPLVIGIRDLFRTGRTKQEKSNNYSLTSIAFVTLSNGADNIGVYVPFFIVSRVHLSIILVTYALLIAIWCFVGRWLGNHPVVLRSIDRWGHWAVPLVFIGLGLHVLIS